MDCAIDIRIQRDDFDVGQEIGRLGAGRPDLGAVVTFTGLCRAEGGRLSALELEHYPGMAEAQIARIVERATERWPLGAVTVIHRFGRIAPGEQIVLVATASTHRHAAFDGASFIMDFLKSEAPFWKKEHAASGDAGEWVDARDSDHEAMKRWDEG
ncbi:MAG TPA: molybdenum cofactor biosynthesis protein MoaE [Rhizobiaceae bacterium]|nr:molybdenum cofactor biosynthesis protein MoaE [Rhizobiaceae bacterium]